MSLVSENRLWSVASLVSCGSYDGVTGDCGIVMLMVLMVIYCCDDDDNERFGTYDDDL